MAQFLVAVVALLAVVVAWFQWWTPRQKLVLDLFDKQRFQVFLDLRTIASEAIQLGKISRPGQMNKITTELIKVHGLVSQLQVGHPPAAMRIMDHFEKMTPLFNRYLRMSQLSPSLPWQRRTSRPKMRISRKHLGAGRSELYIRYRSHDARAMRS
jgi:hypothetical protein